MDLYLICKKENKVKLKLSGTWTYLKNLYDFSIEFFVTIGMLGGVLVVEDRDQWVRIGRPPSPPPHVVYIVMSNVRKWWWWWWWWNHL